MEKKESEFITVQWVWFPTAIPQSPPLQGATEWTNIPINLNESGRKFSKKNINTDSFVQCFPSKISSLLIAPQKTQGQTRKVLYGLCGLCCLVARTICRAKSSQDSGLHIRIPSCKVSNLIKNNGWKLWYVDRFNRTYWIREHIDHMICEKM